MRVPTDLEILEIIYDTYYKEFSSYNTGEKNTRQSKVYLPIDCKLIAKKLKVDNDIVFGRLYNHLNKLHGYRNDDGSSVNFFSLKVGNDIKCIHFPLLASVLAGLQEENRKFNFTVWTSIFAFGISLCALAVSLYDTFNHPL